jgi:hypothetical protein
MVLILRITQDTTAVQNFVDRTGHGKPEGLSLLLRVATGEKHVSVSDR